MENNKKFRLEDCSKEEMQEFKEGMDELLNKLSLKLSLVINKKGMQIKLDNGKVETAFIDQPTLLVQKKIEEVEAEVVTPIESPYNDEPNQAAA